MKKELSVPLREMRTLPVCQIRKTGIDRLNISPHARTD